MHDPYFEAVCADIRGLDLGDDALLAASLDAIGDDLRPEDRLLRGVLRARLDRPTDAATDFEAVATAGHAPSLAWYLAAHVRAQAEDLEAAAARLERSEHAARDDELVGPGDLAHARARLHWLAGDAEAALAAVTRGLERDPDSAARWLDRARLALELGEHGPAKEAIERALELESDRADLHYELAVITSTGPTDPAAPRHWQQVFALDPSLRDRAAKDERLAEARNAAHLAAILGPPPAPDRRWLADAPAWLRSLAEADALTARGVTWLGEVERRRHADDVRAAYEGRGPTGTLHTDATRAESRRRLATMVPVATVPIRPTREGVRTDAELWLDESDPTRVWLAWGDHMPPFLWIDAGRDVEAVTAAIDPLTGDPPRRDELDASVHRAFIGYVGQLVVPHPVTGDLEAGGIPQLEQHLSLSPFLESGAWGSAYDEDPWPDVVPPQRGLTAKIEARQTEVATQSDARPWSMSRRLRFSRGYLTIELHHYDLVVLEVRGRPNPYPQVVEALNETFGCGYPTDLPLDAVAAVIGLVFDTAADLQPQLADVADDEEQLAGLLYVLSALRHSELDAHAIWRAHADHASDLVRATIANIGLAYDFESLLEERALLEPDDDLRAQIAEALDAGLEPPQWDPYADDEADDEAPEP